jgi:hypothetical protein
MQYQIKLSELSLTELFSVESALNSRLNLITSAGLINNETSERYRLLSDSMAMVQYELNERLMSITK